MATHPLENPQYRLEQHGPIAGTPWSRSVVGVTQLRHHARELDPPPAPDKPLDRPAPNGAVRDSTAWAKGA